LARARTLAHDARPSSHRLAAGPFACWIGDALYAPAVRAGQADPDGPTRVVIVGGGFGGLEAAKTLGAAGSADLRVVVVDRRNHHLFQPLLYQVAMAGLSPADISIPIRTVLERYENVEVRLGHVEDVDLAHKTVRCDTGD